KLTLEQAQTIRKEVDDLVSNPERSVDREKYRANDGQIRFVEDYKKKFKITHLGNFFTALKSEWKEMMQWSQMNLTLEQAQAIRKEVDDLVNNPERSVDRKKYRTNDGQIRFVEDYKDKFKATHLGQFFTALKSEWRETMQWSIMNLSLEQTQAIRKEVD